jgi:two-component system phosphate regulon sensor histidine kinase PhoR
VILVLVTCVILFWVSANSLRKFHLQQQIVLLKNIGMPLVPRMRLAANSQKPMAPSKLAKRFAHPLVSKIGLIDESGKPALSSPPLIAPSKILSLLEVSNINSSSGIIGDQDGVSYLTLLIPLGTSAPATYLVLQNPISSLDQQVVELRNTITAIAVILLLLALFLNALTIGKITAIIEKFTLGVQQLAEGNFSHRFLPAPQYELERLSNAMNVTTESISKKLRTITQQRKELDAILRSMSEGVIVVDKHDKVLRINEQCANFFGVQSTQVKGKSVHELIRNSALQAILADCQQQQHAIEQSISIRQEPPQFLQANASPLIDADGESIGALAVLHDVTALRQMEEMRKEFVANVSHELRTPITSIKGFVETLLDGALNEPATAERFLKIISKQSERLNAIIDDLLSLSRLERENNSDVGKISTDINEVLTSAAGLCEQQAYEKSIHISIDCPENLSAEVNPHLLEQAITNLVENAIKYSEENTKVEVRAAIDSNRLYLEVHDNGPGIDQQYLPRLFERFYRVDEGRTRDQGGTGLGLAIVKHIAQAHGGRATVESTVGEGSKFSLILPASGSTPADTESPCE